MKLSDAQKNAFIAAMCDAQQKKGENSNLPYGVTVDTIYEGEVTILEAGDVKQTKENPNFKDLQGNFMTLRVKPIGEKLPKPWAKNIFENDAEAIWDEVKEAIANNDNQREDLNIDGYHVRRVDVYFPFDFKMVNSDGSVVKDGNSDPVISNYRPLLLFKGENLSTVIRREYRQLVNKKALVTEGGGIPSSNKGTVDEEK